MNTALAAKHIRKLDAQLVVAGERLARYRADAERAQGKPDPTDRCPPWMSVIVQRGVVDRLLGQRLVLMDARDAGAGS